MAMFNQWQQPTWPNYPAQNLQPQPQAPTSNLEWIMVNSIEQVEKVTVQPAQKAWIMVQNEPVFALRHADAIGIVTTDYYRFEKYEPMAPAKQMPAAEYVTKAEMNEAIERAIQAIKAGRGAKHESVD